MNLILTELEAATLLRLLEIELTNRGHHWPDIRRLALESTKEKLEIQYRR